MVSSEDRGRKNGTEERKKGAGADYGVDRHCCCRGRSSEILTIDLHTVFFKRLVRCLGSFMSCKIATDSFDNFRKCFVRQFLFHNHRKKMKAIS